MNTPRAAPLLVVAAIIRDGDRILISQRPAGSRLEGGKWEFPGGKVEFAEHPEDCLRREIREELDLEVEVESFFDLVSHVYEGDGIKAHVVILAYLARVIGGELKFLEVADARWIERVNLRDYDFARADLPFIERLLGEA